MGLRFQKTRKCLVLDYKPCKNVCIFGQRVNKTGFFDSAARALKEFLL